MRTHIGLSSRAVCALAFQRLARVSIDVLQCGRAHQWIVHGRTYPLVEAKWVSEPVTRTEFMIESTRRQAIDVLLDRRLFMLDSERYDVFMHALDNPPAPGPKLRSLLRRVPAWQK
jgi:uncharacterized protein (DUF1778 family)